MNPTNPKKNEDLAALLTRYNTPVPRYTSYPTAVEWTSEFDNQRFFQELESWEKDRPLSLYIHIPFCENRCLYCGCNVLISRRRETADQYIPWLLREIKARADWLPARPKITEVHFGGGTPNFLRREHWQDIMTALRSGFQIDDTTEISAEIDPMALEMNGYLEFLATDIGLNRVSFGIQDVTPETGEAVARVAELKHLDRVMETARGLPFRSINCDFIYGLPYQTTGRYNANLNWIQTYRPERLAFFSYAHVPWLKRHQEKMPLDKLPDTTEKIRIYLNARERLCESMGYEAIGMDHFALPEDSLARALAAKKLFRNFMGYTANRSPDILAFGTSGISQLGPVFAQNPLKISAWRRSVEQTEEKSLGDIFAKGYVTSGEDRLRAEIIQTLMANYYFSVEDWRERTELDFWKKFPNLKERLAEFEKQGLLSFSDREIRVNEAGSLVVRHIASLFDAYRRKPGGAGAPAKTFSRGI